MKSLEQWEEEHRLAEERLRDAAAGIGPAVEGVLGITQIPAGAPKIREVFVVTEALREAATHYMLASTSLASARMMSHLEKAARRE